MKLRFLLCLMLLALAIAPSLHAQEAGINPERLENMTYPVNFGGDTASSVTLVDGFYEEPMGSYSNRYVLSESRAFGDLNGDGIEDAAVMMVINTGGTGNFLHLIPVINDGSTLTAQTPLFLGDRWFAQQLLIRQGEIALLVQRHAPDDPFCCPSETALMRFQFSGGALSLIEDRALWRNSSPDALPTGVTQQDWDFALMQSGFVAPEIRFAAGTSSITLLGHLGAAEVDFYNFGALAGQNTSVQLASLEGNVRLQVLDRSTGLLVTGANIAWTGALPSSGNYMIRVAGVADQSAYYLLWVQIQP